MPIAKPFQRLDKLQKLIDKKIEAAKNDPKVWINHISEALAEYAVVFEEVNAHDAANAKKYGEKLEKYLEQTPFTHQDILLELHVAYKNVHHARHIADAPNQQYLAAVRSSNHDISRLSIAADQANEEVQTAEKKLAEIKKNASQQLAFAKKLNSLQKRIDDLSETHERVTNVFKIYAETHPDNASEINILLSQLTTFNINLTIIQEKRAQLTIENLANVPINDLEIHSAQLEMDIDTASMEITELSKKFTNIDLKNNNPLRSEATDNESDITLTIESPLTLHDTDDLSAAATEDEPDESMPDRQIYEAVSIAPLTIRSRSDESSRATAQYPEGFDDLDDLDELDEEEALFIADKTSKESTALLNKKELRTMASHFSQYNLQIAIYAEMTERAITHASLRKSMPNDIEAHTKVMQQQLTKYKETLEARLAQSRARGTKEWRLKGLVKRIAAAEKTLKQADAIYANLHEIQNIQVAFPVNTNTNEANAVKLAKNSENAFEEAEKYLNRTLKTTGTNAELASAIISSSPTAPDPNIGKFEARWYPNHIKLGKTVVHTASVQEYNVANSCFQHTIIINNEDKKLFTSANTLSKAGRFVAGRSSIPRDDILRQAHAEVENYLRATPYQVDEKGNKKPIYLNLDKYPKEMAEAMVIACQQQKYEVKFSLGTRPVHVHPAQVKKAIKRMESLGLLTLDERVSEQKQERLKERTTLDIQGSKQSSKDTSRKTTENSTPDADDERPSSPRPGRSDRDF